MEEITLEMYTIFSLVIGLVIGGAVVYTFFHLGFSKVREELKRAEQDAKQKEELLFAEAEKNGENRKRELLLQAKEEIHKAKQTLESDLKEKRSELLKEKQRLSIKEEMMEKRLLEHEQKENVLMERILELKEKEKMVEQLEKDRLRALEETAQLSLEEARHQVLSKAEMAARQEMATMLRRYEEETKSNAEAMAAEIISTAIQRYSADYVTENTVTVVSLPNDEMKGRIIGREGRNIRAIEMITGVDLIIDDTPEAVILSCFDPIRREIARGAIEKLVLDGRIHPARIEEMVDKARKEVANVMKQEGEKAVLDLGLGQMHPEMIKLLGRMHFRTSYGQNALKHSIEVAWLTGMMAYELGLDPIVARRAGLLHDLGKAVDFEVEGTHVEIGAELARKYGESEVVVNAIASHHGDFEADNPISVLVAAADAISAARPGARRENIETYIKRLQQLEEIAMSFDGVEKCYAVKAGREIRVMVQPEKVNDDQMILTAKEICKRIENELKYPGTIKINLIRETKHVEVAK